MTNSTVNFTSEASTNVTYNLTHLDICVHSINVLFGLPTHTYVIWLIITGTGNGVASEFFNLNLSFCEIGICLNSLLALIDFYSWFSHLAISADFLLGLAITGRPLFQCLMCVERYLAVVHPVTFLKFKPLRYRVICCTVVWIITLGSCLCCMFTANQDYFYIYVYFYSIQFIVFFSIHLYCLVAVLRALKQSGPGERGRLRGREEENHMKRRAFYLILITSISMSVIYMPFIISGLYFIVSHLLIVDIFSFGLFCFILAGFVQPVLYLHRAKKMPCLCLFTVHFPVWKIFPKYHFNSFS